MSYLAMNDDEQQITSEEVNNKKLLESLANDIISTRAEKEHYQALTDEAAARLKTLELRMVQGLESLGVESVSVCGYTFYLYPIFSASLPDSEEDRKAFFDYIKERGLFESMITVHKKKLSKWYQSELNNALEQGDIDFSVPGISDVSSYVNLGMRKK